MAAPYGPKTELIMYGLRYLYEFCRHLCDAGEGGFRFPEIRNVTGCSLIQDQMGSVLRPNMCIYN
jgi:hypothetical protein